ncbi:MAG: diacylglycerol kinase family protein [Bacillota bacterium]|nr:diacylglycerol kinase family protein [Bacillota bacterium]
MKKTRDSIKYALCGIKYAFESQRNIRIQLVIMIIAYITGYILNISSTDWLILILISTIILTLEIINTALEEVVNLVTEEYRKTAKHAKDTAAGAVLTASFFAIIIGLIIFIPKIV